MAMDSTGVLYVWGSNQYGVLMDGTTTDRFSPEIAVLPVPSSQIAGYSIGYFSMIVSTSGLAYTGGRFVANI